LNRESTLAAGGRGTRKELGMPIASDRARLIDEGAGLDLDHHDNGRRNRYRRGAVHHDAKGTVVGI